MTIQQLEYVVALDNERHFVRAAETCFVTQPTLTMQIQKLEDEIGLRLFSRTSKPLKPTEAGELFVLKARQILRDIDELKSIVRDEKDTLQGTFRMGIIPTLSPYLLPRFIQKFLHEHPNLELIVNEMQSEQIIEGLQKGSIDIGLLATPLNEQHLREIPVFNEPFYGYFPPDHRLLKKKKIKQTDVQNENLILLSQGHCFRNQMLSYCGTNRKKSQPAFIYESGSLEALKNMVQAGMGSSLIPELALNLEQEKGNFKPFSEPVPAREISVVVHHSFSRELLIEHLRKSIHQSIPQKLVKNTRFFRVDWR